VILATELLILALVESAPGHQETPKPPSGGFLFGLAEDEASTPNEARSSGSSP